MAGYDNDASLDALIKGALSGKGEVNSFVANSAHRLRSTLTAMRFQTELIQSGVYGSIEGDLIEKVGAIENGIDELTGFINEMQDLTTASNLPIPAMAKRSDLYAIAYDVMKRFSTNQACKIKLALSNSPVVEAMADEFFARKALGYLIAYTLSGSDQDRSGIELKVEIGDDGPSVTLRSGIEPLGKAEMEALVRSMLKDAAALSALEWKRFSLPLAVFFGNHIGSRLRVDEVEDGTWEYRMIFREP